MLSNNDVKALRKNMNKKTVAPPAAQPAAVAKVQ
jgi:hypothetical protein